MRLFHIDGTQARELPDLAAAAPQSCPQGYLWISLTREELRASLAEVQAALRSLCGTVLVDLHVSDLLNDQLPSHHDYTSDYDVLVFRRLVGEGAARRDPAAWPAAPTAPPPAPTPVIDPIPRRGGLPALRRIDTRPVGFAVFDRVLLSVHPEDGSMRDLFAAKISAASHVAAAPALDARALSARLPTSPAELMLRVINHIVDGYLDLRRDLSRQIDHWQAELLDSRSRFSNWGALMQARQALRHLNDVGEDQRDAVRDWIDELEAQAPVAPGAAQDQELLLVRGRDVVEHIERVTHHVRRLEQDAETAVQMHFNIQSHRTNDIMRVLTVLTAVFLPLNLIAGIFGMNFDTIPLLHKADGFWIALTSMLLIALVLVLVFWRKRYLARTSH